MAYNYTISGSRSPLLLSRLIYLLFQQQQQAGPSFTHISSHLTNQQRNNNSGAAFNLLFTFHQSARASSTISSTRSPGPIFCLSVVFSLLSISSLPGRAFILLRVISSDRRSTSSVSVLSLCFFCIVSYRLVYSSCYFLSIVLFVWYRAYRFYVRILFIVSVSLRRLVS